MFTDRFQEWVRAGARRIVPALRLLGFTPNALTLIGLAICAASAVLVATGNLVVGGVLLLLASAFDILDGAVARVTGKVYRYGAFLDSTTDRYAESFTYIALLWYFTITLTGHHVIEPMLVILALTGSLLVSYVRARAQSLGFVCDGGIFARPERVVLTVIGLLVPPVLFGCLVALAVLTNLTAVQRIWFVWRQSLKTAPADT
ncbi:MAG: CDP-alcohol phosphatidyltransferase family protein [Candidatus Dormibacteraeota bacterium]|uniref:CDP-alcohol phosphatidyltransferase family protein n=1 Tax=Candidatus Amunia macphersoniae TaxID=3127014 RepID=A0A934KC40_9BACT|nr:CDP-alcohol phosphatidyltransferase family protein [Candidatus Dormibacteraeota bacterium]